MKTTAHHPFRIAAALGLVALVVTGMRCNGFAPGEPAAPTKFQVPTYTEKTVLGKIIWPSEKSIDQTVLAVIPAAEREKIKLSGVPVLVPSDPKFLMASQVFTPSERGYNFGTQDWVDGIDFTIHGGRVSSMSDAPVPPELYEDNPSDVLVNGYSVSFSQNENENWSATWGGHGEVGYLMSLYCQDRTDPRCLDKTYFIELVRSLVFVGGNFIPYETEVQK